MAKGQAYVVMAARRVNGTITLTAPVKMQHQSYENNHVEYGAGMGTKAVRQQSTRYSSEARACIGNGDEIEREVRGDADRNRAYINIR